MARLLLFVLLCLTLTFHLGCSMGGTEGDDEMVAATEGMEDEGGDTDVTEDAGDEPADVASEDAGMDEEMEQAAPSEKKQDVASNDADDLESDFDSDDSFADDDKAPVAKGDESDDLDADFEDDKAVAETDTPPSNSEPAPDVADVPADQSTEPMGLPQESGPPMVVTAIDFLSNQSGGSIAIKTSAPAQFKTRYNDKTNQFVVEFQNTTISSAMKRPYIMKDFETSFGAINAYQTPGSLVARVVVQMKGPGEPVAQQEGSSVLIVPGTGAPMGSMASNSGGAASNMPEDDRSYDKARTSDQDTALSARSLDEFLTGSGKFYGKPISIETKDVDVREVIGFIAEESGVNLVIGDDVEGKVSLKLRSIPWDQALVIVMKSKGLGYIRQGSVIRITKLTTLQAEAQISKAIVEAQKNLAPLRVKVMPISYATVSDLQNQVTPFLTPNRGQVISDGRTSSLIVTDTAETLDKVERLVKELDIPPAQVMIEGKVVEANEIFNKRLGVNWGWGGAATEISPKGGLNGNPINLNLGARSTSLQQDQIAAGNGFLNLRIGAFDFFGDLNAQLSLAQSDSLVRIISSPRIVAMNKTPAEISQKGEVITINTTTDIGRNVTSTATRTPVSLRLTVTPQVTNEGSVLLDVDVLREFAGAEADPGTKARPINSRAAKTKVLVPNGQTAVIGGIYQNDEANSESGIPGLKDLPVFGWLFKSRSESREKNELIIFLTPRILNAKDQAVTTQ